MYSCVICMPTEVGEGTGRAPEAGVKSSCKLLYLNAGTWTQILCNISDYSLPLNHLSSLPTFLKSILLL